jgi:hypothetical protein
MSIDPISLAVIAASASAVTAATSAGMSYVSSKQQEEAQEQYNEYLEKQAIQQYAELDKQEADVIETSYKESMQAQREYMKARSTVELQAAASGTYGQSIDLAITDLGTGLGQRMSDITSRREMQLDNIDIQSKNIAAQAKGSSDYTIKQPAWYSGLSTGLSTFQRTYGIASDIGKAYTESSTVTPTQSRYYKKNTVGSYDPYYGSIS